MEGSPRYGNSLALGIARVIPRHLCWSLEGFHSRFHLTSGSSFQLISLSSATFKDLILERRMQEMSAHRHEYYEYWLPTCERECTSPSESTLWLTRHFVASVQAHSSYIIKTRCKLSMEGCGTRFSKPFCSVTLQRPHSTHPVVNHSPEWNLACFCKLSLFFLEISNDFDEPLDFGGRPTTYIGDQ